MKCMCAQTRPRFILSSEGVLGGMEFEPMLTPREKSPLPENFPRGGSNPRRCGQRAQTLPTSYSPPPPPPPPNQRQFESGQNKSKACSYILDDRECNPFFVTTDTSCKLSFKRDNILQLRTRNSFVDYQLPCPQKTFSQDTPSSCSLSFPNMRI